MTDATDRFVIRRHTPARTRMLQWAAAGIGLFALYVFFELGRYSAGFDRANASQEHAAQQRIIAGLNNQIGNLHAQVAQLQTTQAGAAREHEEVGQEIAELQGQIDRDRQDLAVYRGVIAPASSGTSLQVQQLLIATTETPNHFVVHLTLMQAGKPDAAVTGNVSVRVLGQLNGTASVVDGQSSAASGAVSFRYYQAIDYQMALPEGFQPQQVQVSLRDGRANGTAGTQNFPWRIDVQP